MVGMTKSRGLIAKRGTRAAWIKREQGRHFCGCGCEQPIRLRPEHYSEGIPRYLHGHNPQPTNPRPPRQPCACGCGDLATAGRRFISGHNGRGIPRSPGTRAKLSRSKLGDRNPQFGKKPWNAKPPAARAPCRCGCGQLAGPGRIYLSGHNVRGETGEAARAYQGGRHRRVTGYIFVLMPQHPYALADGYVQEHRLVLEQHLRETDPDSPYLERLGDQLYLRRDITAHHRNDVKDDNRPENLQPLTNGEHVALHHEQRRNHKH